MNPITQTDTVGIDCCGNNPVGSDSNFVKFLLIKWKCILVLSVLLTIILNIFFLIITQIVRGIEAGKLTSADFKEVLTWGESLQSIIAMLNINTTLNK